MFVFIRKSRWQLTPFWGGYCSLSFLPAAPSSLDLGVLKGFLSSSRALNLALYVASKFTEIARDASTFKQRTCKPWLRKHTFLWLSLIVKGWQHRNELMTRPEWNQPVRQELRVEGRRLDQVLRDLLGRDPGDQDRLLREGQPGPSGADQLSRPWASGSPGPHLQRLSLSPQVTTQTFIPFCYFQAYYLDIFPQILPPGVGKTLIFLAIFFILWNKKLVLAKVR